MKIMMNLWKIIAAVAVRLGLIVHCMLTVWRVADIENNDLYWLLALTNVLMIIEGIYRVIKQDGEESKW